MMGRYWQFETMLVLLLQSQWVLSQVDEWPVTKGSSVERVQVQGLADATDRSAEIVHQASGLSFPLQLGGLTRSTVSDFETQSPGMGFGYRYRGSGPTEGVEAIVYVYNLRVKEMPSDLQSPMLAQIRQMTRREIAHQAELQSLIARPVFGNTLRMKGERGSMEALFDGFALDAPGKGSQGYHFAALWTAKNHFIKLKVLRGAQSVATPDIMGGFVQAVLAQTYLSE